MGSDQLNLDESDRDLETLETETWTRNPQTWRATAFARSHLARQNLISELLAEFATHWTTPCRLNSLCK
jgi:hypothetical protein